MKHNPDNFYFEETDFKNVWFLFMFWNKFVWPNDSVFITIMLHHPIPQGETPKRQVADIVNTKGLYQS